MALEAQPEVPLLSVEGVVKHYPPAKGSGRRAGALRAVDGVSFAVGRQETLGIVGESGCGKSTLARTLLRLVEPTSGHVYFKGDDVFAMSRRELREFRRRVQVVLQDPFESLNPRKTVEQIISEPWQIHHDLVPRRARRGRAAELLEMVGLRPDNLNRFPAQFSGGQRQRIGIARALAVDPELIICDEPVSALDVSVQAQVVNLLQDIQRELKLSYVFIAHDLGVVRHLADNVGVMYLGKMVEYGTETEVFTNPRHPYTRALLSAVPAISFGEARTRKRTILAGEVPSAADPPSGCHFRTRCPVVQDVCALDEPALEDRGLAGHPVACHFATPINHVISSPA